MKKTFLFLSALLMTAGVFTACDNDDTDFSNYTLVNDDDDDDDNDTTTVAVTDTIYITYNNTSATVSGDTQGLVTTSNAHVTVNDLTSARGMVLVLSGSATDGSLIVYRTAKYTLVLNGVSIANANGPAINNQCSKALYVECADSTTNSLSDGTAYSAQTYDQKGALFSEGQIFFSGSGTLNVNGSCKNAIASDDYITIDGDIVINAVTASTGSNGIKANDGMYINGGTLTINVASNGGRGIRCEARTTITGGDIKIITTGDCVIETVDGVADTTSAAGIKCDSLFSMTGGTLTIRSSGDGGKGINCNENIEFSGGTLDVQTTGDNEEAKPKAVKSDTGIIVSGGSFTAKVSKSWACDNGTESETPEDHLTVVGTPSSSTITKKTVIINY